MTRTIACYTLGCKVNQYDTQAMLELFENDGWRQVDFDSDADVYLINTCTVTGTGDQKSLKTIRRVAREHPGSAIIVAGCLAQRDAERVALPGVRLIVGSKRRGEVVELLKQALESGKTVSAVEQKGSWEFENLSISRHEGKTRAVMKIQEGCDRYCAYCVIPYVRGPVRSMDLKTVESEARRLADAGYREIVVTGIHLQSYGRGTENTLIDAIRVINGIDGVSRVRLGSLEPVIVTDAWIEEMLKLNKVCPQFHLSMQSGSAGVLKRMRRRYTPEEYLIAARKLQDAYEDCAVTTDVLTGFPGENDFEADETERFIQQVGFAKIHVFPYSRRAGTLADGMPGQVPEEIKHERCIRLIEIGNKMRGQFVHSLVGKTKSVLFETDAGNGTCQGYTDNYVRVVADAKPGALVDCLITGADGDELIGQPL